MIELQNTSIYCRAGRFQTLAFEEPYLDITQTIIDTLKLASETDCFTLQGKLSGLLGLKLYGSDPRIDKLNQLCLNQGFEYLRSRGQMKLIDNLLETKIFISEPTNFQKAFLKSDEKIDHFISAIKTKNLDQLKAFRRELQIGMAYKANATNKKPLTTNKLTTNELIADFYIKCGTLVRPEDRAYDKHQCLLAADWMLKTLQKKVPHIIDTIKAYSEKQKKPKQKRVLDLTPLQKRTFVVTLADLIWDMALVGRVNLGEAAIRANYSSPMMKQAMTQANIVFEGQDQELARVCAYVYKNKSSSFELGYKYGEITNKNLKLPRDEVVYWRDLVSTIAVCQSNDPYIPGLGGLANETRLLILQYLAPSHMSVEQIYIEFKWNVTRLADLKNSNFDKQLVYLSNLLKLR